MVLLAPAIVLKLINPKSLMFHIIFLLGMKAAENLLALQHSDERQVRYKRSYRISPQVHILLGTAFFLQIHTFKQSHYQMMNTIMLI